MKFNFILISLVLILSSCGNQTGDNLAPEIEAELIDGTPFKLSELRGEYVVLDFWGSWCGPCLRDIPKLMQLHTKYGDKVVFVSVAFERDDRRWKSVSKKAGFTWKHQIVEKAKILLASPISRAYGVTDIPAKFIVTPKGELISGMDFEQMDAYLAATLAE
ncbi:MAG: TlpA family protein disulfide reductase [Flavobacteriales bacterium]